jgi:hypothetical protein
MKPMIALSIEHYEPLLKGATEASPVGGNRIQDKTRWTKALGEAGNGCLWGLYGRDSPKQIQQHG